MPNQNYFPEFKPGTLGDMLIYIDSKTYGLIINPPDFFTINYKEFQQIPNNPKKIKRMSGLEKAILTMEEPYETNPDDVLTILGYYRSTEKRSCCRRKQE